MTEVRSVVQLESAAELTSASSVSSDSAEDFPLAPSTTTNPTYGESKSNKMKKELDAVAVTPDRVNL